MCERFKAFVEAQLVLLHDKAPAHSDLIMQCFLANRNVEICHLHYSSNLAPAKLFSVFLSVFRINMKNSLGLLENKG
jgi:hypothetical protein